MFEMFYWGQSFFETITKVGDFLFQPNEDLASFVNSVSWESIPLIGQFVSDLMIGIGNTPIAYVLTGSLLVSLLLFCLIKFFVGLVK